MSSGLSPDILERAQVRIFAGSGELLKKRLGFSRMGGINILRTYRLVEVPYLDDSGVPVRYGFKPSPPSIPRVGEVYRSQLKSVPVWAEQKCTTPVPHSMRYEP